jgi:hypothetical protein
MVRRLLSVLTVAALVAVTATSAFAQGGGSTSSLVGTVLDTSGAAIPGATIEAKHAGTGAVYTTVSSSQGSFSIPALPTGKYNVSISLQGFKTASIKDIELNIGQPATVSVKLEIGGMTDVVNVEATAAMVQTQSTTVSSTINTKQIESLPLTSRNVIDFLTFLPGVNVAGTNRQANVNGLPGAAVNITLDGVNIQDNTLKSTDGFFTIVQPRLDAIEEVTLTGAASGAGDSQGAISVKFTTRSGTNAYTGSLYNYFRSDKLNENTYFNKRDGVAKPKLKQNQTGGRIGGPIQIPGLFDGRNKAFFFMNIENFNQPSELTRRRTILNPLAQAGNFRYTTTGGAVTSVNLLAVAAAAGQTNTIDPTISALLNDIRTAATSTGSITDQTDPLYQDFNYNVMQKSNNWFPTGRVDWNFGANHRLSTVYNHDVFDTKPDAATNGFESTFPGFPNFGSQTSKRRALSSTMRSTIGRNFVNEARFGFQSSPVLFFPEQETTTPWTSTTANQKGFQLNISAAGITNAGPAPNAQSRNVNTFLYEDTINYQKGSHSLSGGLSITDLNIWAKNITAVPTVTFGIQTADPASSMFNTTNFPGASTTNLNNARALYAVLTGRITQIAGNARIDETTGNYVYQGAATQRGRMIETGAFVQDTWRARPDLTVNMGLRYEVQGAFRPSNSLYSYMTPEDVFGRSGLSSTCNPTEPTAQTCNIFKNTLPGAVPTFKKLEKGTKAYNTDYNNFAPNIGINWTPSFSNSFLTKIAGEPGQFSVRGAWTRSYLRNGMNDFTSVFNANPGILIQVTKNESLNNLGSNVVLLRNDSQTGPATFPTSPTYPLSGVVTNSTNAFAPDLRVPYADTYTFGVQRGISKNMAAEVRYVGTRSRDAITTYNLNGEANIIDNGFLSEFRAAQRNLELAIAAGKGANFKYDATVAGSQPLPIYLAYFQGINAAGAQNAANYTSANFANSTFVNSLAKFNPNPFTAAGNLAGSGAAAAQRSNALAAGLPANFFFVNPDYLGAANITGNGGFTRYNSVQMELRRRLANGFQFQANYVFGYGFTSQRYSFRVPRLEVRSTGNGGEVTHALKGNLVLDLPFGRGRRFLNGAGEVLDRIVGGWQFNVNFRVQSGRLVDLGNVRMVGFDKDALRSMFKLRKDATNRIYFLPENLINETIKAFSVSATTATGYGALGAPSGMYFAPANGPDCIESINGSYGDCGTRELIVRGPMVKEADMSLVKSLQIIGRLRAEFRVEALNVFNNVNITPVGGLSSTLTNYESTGLTGINTSRVVQLVSRITW